MDNLKGKILKIYLNTMSGIVVETGVCLGADSDFIIINNQFSKKIQYISKFYIKYFEILNEFGEALWWIKF